MTVVAGWHEWVSEEKLALLEGWSRDGLSYMEVAKNMGVNVGTLQKWRKASDQIEAALRKGREVSDYLVENALFRRAVGFMTTEKKTVTRLDPNGGESIVEVTETEKHVLPDTLAQIFYLKNRRPQEWRDRREVGLEGTVGLVQIVDDLGGDRAPAQTDDGSELLA